jgi:hypothetical protein
MATPIAPLPQQMQRLYKDPLDPTSVWTTKAQAETYALTNPTAYPGQPVSWNDGQNMMLGVIQPDNTILELPIACGWVTVATLSDRNLIPMMARRQLMVANIIADGSRWTLIGGLTNTYWTELVFGDDMQKYTVNAGSQVVIPMTDIGTERGVLVQYVATRDAETRKGTLNIVVSGTSAVLTETMVTGTDCGIIIDFTYPNVFVVANGKNSFQSTIRFLTKKFHN